MLRNLDIALLRTLAAVADHGSMTAAGHALNVTQGAVSQQIGRLEALLGGDLLVRDRRGITLTPSGERLLGQGRRLLALNDEIWAEVDGIAVAGQVRLGVPGDLVGACLTPALTRFGAACPQVELSLSCGSSADLRRDIASRRIDVALLEEPVDSVTGECLAVERLVWVGAQGGRVHAKVPLPVSIVAETCAFRPVVLAALKRQRRAWRTMFKNGSIEATLATVRADLAVTACLAVNVPADVDILPPASGLPRLPPFAITLHMSDGPPTPAMGELARHLRDALTRPRQGA